MTCRLQAFADGTGGKRRDAESNRHSILCDLSMAFGELLDRYPLLFVKYFLSL